MKTNIKVPMRLVRPIETIYGMITLFENLVRKGRKFYK